MFFMFPHVSHVSTTCRLIFCAELFLFDIKYAHFFLISWFSLYFIILSNLIFFSNLITVIIIERFGKSRYGCIRSCWKEAIEHTFLRHVTAHFCRLFHHPLHRQLVNFFFLIFLREKYVAFWYTIFRLTAKICQWPKWLKILCSWWE